MNFLCLFIGLTFCLPAFSQNTTSLKGQITDEKTGESIPFAELQLWQDDVAVTSTVSDFDGYYQFGLLEPGSYTLKFAYVGYDPKVEDILIKERELTNHSFTVNESSILIIYDTVPATRTKSKGAE